MNCLLKCLGLDYKINFRSLFICYNIFIKISIHLFYLIFIYNTFNNNKNYISYISYSQMDILNFFFLSKSKDTLNYTFKSIICLRVILSLIHFNFLKFIEGVYILRVSRVPSIYFRFETNMILIYSNC